jgi:uncharacterized protein (TIGR01777 family)
MHVVIAGSSGFLGTHLIEHLRGRGHTVTPLVRRDPRPGEARWDPYAGQLDQAVVDEADVLVNLAGTPTAGNPHSKKWARGMRESRLTTTRVLAEAVATSAAKPAFLAQGGIGFYGDHGDELLDESADSRGHEFMTVLSRDWEAASAPARESGARVAVLRTSPVIDRSSPPLAQLVPLFKLGLGARLGSGRQYMPIISLRDWLAAVTFVAEHDQASGPVNLVCPDTPTNAEFTDVLARALGRRAVLFAPGFVLDKAAGRLANELLGSVRAVPAALQSWGYTFTDQDARDVIAAGLGQHR